ncbi:hypothetical protein GCM10020229_52080 [Kitasatospora albolonga]
MGSAETGTLPPRAVSAASRDRPVCTAAASSAGSSLPQQLTATGSGAPQHESATGSAGPQHDSSTGSAGPQQPEAGSVSSTVSATGASASVLQQVVVIVYSSVRVIC